ncbi:hypothetical protein PROFUN_08342 [Planoprotostelium fungivorum]|uniref:Uncharacterized protein n=1 Tax=Planoprotostelium fungivorum TaxID=1890364 RepID=A0A2P6NI26_9EUKA|nr:hypothetical protein PROFUN_08342 [Planoprotostelium fungivorum]
MESYTQATPAVSVVGIVYTIVGISFSLVVSIGVSGVVTNKSRRSDCFPSYGL